MRPETERRLRESFQRRFDEQSNRYAAQLAQARQQAARFGCGDVAGVFGGQAGGGIPPRTFVVALLPLVVIPILLFVSAARIPDIVALLVIFPFLAVAWMGASLWLGREPTRQVWLYAFTDGFLLQDGPPADATPVRWSQVTEVIQVWGETRRFGDDGDTTPVLRAYRLRSADGRVHEISRSFRNVQDPYGEMGQLFRGLAPGTVGKTMPRVPTIDEIIATYAGKPGRSA